MILPPRDPNRPVYGAEAATMQARVELETAQLPLVRKAYDSANAALDTVQAELAAVEARYFELKAFHADALDYACKTSGFSHAGTRRTPSGSRNWRRLERTRIDAFVL
jgi:hypothetical protein